MADFSTISDLVKKYSKSTQFQELESFLKENHKSSILGSCGSFLSFCVSQLFATSFSEIVFIATDKEKAQYILNELEGVFGKEKVLFFPESYKTPYQTEEVNNANVVLRTEVLQKLSGKSKKVVVTYPKAITEKVVSSEGLEGISLELSVGQEIAMEDISNHLFEYDFKRVDFVSSPGEFSIRGGILDVFSFSAEKPFRIGFFGDEIERITTFDTDSQGSLEQHTKLSLSPNTSLHREKQYRKSFFKLFSKNTLVCIQDLQGLKESIKKSFAKAEQVYASKKGDTFFLAPTDSYLNSQELSSDIENLKNVLFKGKQTEAQFKVQQIPQPNFQKNFEILSDNLLEYQSKDYGIFIVFSAEKQAKRLKEILEDVSDDKINFTGVIGNLHQGFVDHDSKTVCYTDHQIFERYHKFESRGSFTKKESLTLKELTALKIGDYVTHIDHGIGKFGGLQKIENNGKVQEAIKLTYQNGDLLYVNIHSLHKISKFSGEDAREPKLNKLGSPAWKNLKKKTKTRVKKMAFDLIKLYAKRKSQKGFSFSEDGYLQNELEASFMYEDTPDQYKATEAVKADMEAEKVMDRLVCGDVGFGKTEVAIRAAFKAATDGKQVVVLVPTTILAFQHYRSFSSRLKDFPVSIDYLNRFRTAKQKKEILEKVENGQIDILIGTHQIVSPNVKYKDLGLLIVDEEHKFGVNVKEKLKTLRANLDTLTLTATPIPRTLQFSLMSARDLSVIKTPPPNRQPVETELIGFNQESIRDAISYEVQRGGQVYFINNRIENLPEITGMIQRLVPEAKVVYAHGQMEGKKMEETLLSFMEGEFDVLVATTIVESGLDVSAANTILINNAHGFGLADLHQMRGRVGRSNKKAFCKLITPPLSTINNDARKRLEAIVQFSDLGSGFLIAMKDLEIRGAGDLLGAEQSGFINDIGFDTYQKILAETVKELKSSDFKELFEKENKNDSISEDYIDEVIIDTDISLHIPDEYINSVNERLSVYQSLSEVKTEKELQDWKKNIEDRFGRFPDELHDLLLSFRLKWLCKSIGFEKLVLKKGIMLGYFLNDPKSSYFQSEKFTGILTKIHQIEGAIFKEKPPKTKDGLPVLLLRFENISSLEKAFSVLENINDIDK